MGLVEQGRMDESDLWAVFGEQRPPIPSIAEMHQRTHEHSLCAVMFVSNLKSPDWMYVQCGSALTNAKVAVCSFQDTDSFIHEQRNFIFVEKLCPTNMLKFKSNCFLVTWSYGGATSQEKQKRQGMTLTDESWMLHPIFHEILQNTLKLTPVLLCGDEICSTVQRYHRDKLRGRYTPEQKVSGVSTGYQIFQMPTIEVAPGINVILCTSGSHISVFQLCSKQIACESGLPQTLCVFFNASAPQKHCTTILSQSKENKCVLFDTSSNTNNRLKQKDSVQVLQSPLFTCNNMTLPRSLVDDLIPDCGAGVQDEQILQALVINNRKMPCKNRTQVPCQPGHLKCYDIWDTCVFNLNRYFHTMPCRNAAHLQNCRLFQCNRNYKCPEFYCIPWNYVCNERWDCPKGSDETENACMLVRICKGMFKCDGICIPISSVCDGIKHCHGVEDEQFCALSSVHCPTKCLCLAFAIQCKRTFLDLASTAPFVFVSMENMALGDTIVFRNFPLLSVTKLVNISLTQICHSFPGKDLSVLIAMFNQIPQLETHCFKNNKRLSVVQLSFNKITFVQDQAFGDLPKLSSLNLSNNALKSLSKEFLGKSIHSLSLSNNILSRILFNIFQKFPPKILETNDFTICCVTPESECKCNRQWFSSCEVILPYTEGKTILLAVCNTIIFVNTLSIVLHFVFRKRSQSNTLLATSLNVAEMLLGMYIEYLAVVKMIHTNRHSIKHSEWTSGAVCFLSSVLALNFGLAGPACYLLLALSRLMLVVHPVDTAFKRPKFVAKCIGYLHFVFLCLCVAVVFLFVHSAGQFPNLLCLVVVDASDTHSFCRAAAVLLLCFHVSVSITITLMSVSLVKEYKQSQVNITKTKTSSTKTMISRLLVSGISTTLCWSSADVVFLTALIVPKYPIDMIIWTVLTVMPVTAVLNPLLLVFSLMKSVWKDSHKNK